MQQQQQHQHPLRDTQNGRATPFPLMNLPDTDSGYGDDECTRPINWVSVLSLSSQSPLDPLNNNDLFTSPASPNTITPVVVTTTSTVIAPPLISPPLPITSSSSSSVEVIAPNNSQSSSIEEENGVTATTPTSSTTTTTLTSPVVIVQSNNSPSSISTPVTTQQQSITSSSSQSSMLSTTGTTTTILTSASSLSIGIGGCGNSITSTSITPTSSYTSYWDYSIFESDFGLDTSDLTELLPSWKLTPLSADDILKSVPPPMEPSKVMHDNEIDSFTHIMVGS